MHTLLGFASSRRGPLISEGAYKYLVIGTTGTSMFVLGSALVYGSTGTVTLSATNTGDPIFAHGCSLPDLSPRPEGFRGSLPLLGHHKLLTGADFSRYDILFFI
ncbi:MAG: hypothetical protein Q9N34_02750 [Aquificota bacterium]|nr:hypothetical protein [Aquificota bacterium]